MHGAVLRPIYVVAGPCLDRQVRPYVMVCATSAVGRSDCSSFITARYKGNDDRIGFIDAVMEQLADMLGQPMPAYLTEATREPHLLGMLTEAAAECEAQNERLILVVDGLDEDRGVTTDPDAHSIAALLPARPPVGLRIIVAGRPDPPIPTDVPDDHPLRNPAIVRVLHGSRWADVVKADMQRELKRLLHGTQTEQDLLGLVTAAGGGLSAKDLAELTAFPMYEVEENLHAVAGRTFASRTSHSVADTAASVYVLGHEEIQTTATAYLGQERLAEYRGRIHGWAGRYRRRSWPTGTPEYLLRGYFRMLHVTRDIPRLVGCGTDQARHDRMLDVTGGDTAALTEITDTQDMLLSRVGPDLLAIARLAVHRTNLAERNINIPVALSIVWALTGDLDRADALASAMTDPNARVEALIGLAQAASGVPDPERARALTRRSEEAARAITNQSARAEALASVAQAVASLGDLKRAERITHAIVDRQARVEALMGVAKVDAQTGDIEEARALTRRAERLAQAINNHHLRARVLASVARAAANMHDLEQADAVAQVITDPGMRAQSQLDLARMAAQTGDLEMARAMANRAEESTRGIKDPTEQAAILVSAVRTAVEVGDLDGPGRRPKRLLTGMRGRRRWPAWHGRWRRRATRSRPKPWLGELRRRRRRSVTQAGGHGHWPA